MAARKKLIAGHKVEIWETSFRVEGMSMPVWIGPHITDKMVEQIVTAVHNAVAGKAEKEGRRRASDALCNGIHNLIMEA